MSKSYKSTFASIPNKRSCLLNPFKFLSKKYFCILFIVGSNLCALLLFSPVRLEWGFPKMHITPSVRRSMSHGVSATEKDMCMGLLYSKNSSRNQQAKRYMEVHPRKTIMAEAYQSFTTNCSQYLSDSGFIIHNITDIEARFPIAFYLVVYKHVEQIERLLRAIYRPQNVYCIHVDKKSSNNIYDAIKAIAKCLQNVFLVSQRINVQWGRYSVLEPELLCMKELFEHKVKWRYVINLTGQEYPLKTNYELVKILESFKGANDIQGSSKILNRDRVDHLPPAPHHITPCKGSLHMTASRAFVDYVLHNKVASDFREWIKKAGVPDEIYFTSLNNNKHLHVPGSYTGNPDEKSRDYFARHKIWYGTEECGSKYFVRGICIQGVADLYSLRNSPQLFVNKIHYDFEPLTFDCLEMWYFHKVRQEMNGILDFDTTLYCNSTVVRYRYTG